MSIPNHEFCTAQRRRFRTTVLGANKASVQKRKNLGTYGHRHENWTRRRFVTQHSNSTLPPTATWPAHPTMPSDAQSSVLDKIFSPATLAKLDAFPKVPSAYKARSESRGFMTLFVVLLGFILVLNDFGEYFWGWPDHEFKVDGTTESYMHVNLDMVVAMPCGCAWLPLSRTLY